MHNNIDIDKGHDLLSPVDKYVAAWGTATLSGQPPGPLQPLLCDEGFVSHRLTYTAFVG